MTPRMTVCIAAICKWKNAEMVVCTSDQMLTAGPDIEYEPPRRKTYHFGNHVVALWAGDAASLLEISKNAYIEFLSRPAASVGEVAEIFARNYATFRRRQAEQAILAPLGLDTNSFIAQQRNMATGLVDQLASDLQHYSLDAEAIITGVDRTGDAHIYQVTDPGHAAMHSGVGFASVGIGSNHAESQFMFRRYTRDWPFERALFLSYTAKRRAETAPGVGVATDMIFIGPYPGGWQIVSPDSVEVLRKVHDEVRTGITEVEERAQKQIEKMYRDLEEGARKNQQQAAGAHEQKAGEADSKPRKEAKPSVGPGDSGPSES